MNQMNNAGAAMQNALKQAMQPQDDNANDAASIHSQLAGQRMLLQLGTANVRLCIL
jgi:hypothetical protein